MQHTHDPVYQCEPLLWSYFISKSHGFMDNIIIYAEKILFSRHAYVKEHEVTHEYLLLVVLPLLALTTSNLSLEFSMQEI